MMEFQAFLSYDMFEYLLSQLDELFDAFEDVSCAHDGVAGVLLRELFVRNDHEVDGVGVVQLGRVADDLLQFHGETSQLQVFDGGCQHCQIVVETRDGVNRELRCLECFLCRLNTKQKETKYLLS